MMAIALDAEEAPRLTPPLKWAGGKRWLVPTLQTIWARSGTDLRLVEPFVGGLAVALGLSPKAALLNDANPHIINFYRWLQRGLDIANLGVPLVKDPIVYKENRLRFNELILSNQSDTPEAAALFYYLNRTGFNGLCRFNSKGLFNVPFGQYKTIAYRRDFSAYRLGLAPFEFTCGDFQKLDLSNEFVYADPPYDVEFTTYSAGGFTWDDQVRLAQWLAQHRGPVVASNQATKRVMQLYSSLGFSVKTLGAPRRISCDGNRDDAREMLATKNL